LSYDSALLELKVKTLQDLTQHANHRPLVTRQPLVTFLH